MTKKKKADEIIASQSTEQTTAVAEKKKASFSKDRARKFMFGTKDDMGFLKKLITYVILISIGFIFIYPLIKMVSTSLMSLDDLLDSSIKWIPSSLDFKNYGTAARGMDYWKALKDSLLVAGIPTLLQVCVCSFVGYGLARYDFKGKKAIFALLIFSFVVPPQILTMPTYSLYKTLGLDGTLNAFIIPALVGQGFKSQLFILICWSFFKQIPTSLTEAAQIDGSGHMKSFFKIAIPSATGALVVVFLFSFVWYWNEQYLTHLFLYSSSEKSNYTPLINALSLFSDNYVANSASGGSGGSTPTLSMAVQMAATIISILPLLILYFIMQKQFVESIDNAGITGE